MYKQMFSIQNNNNGVLTADNAMPLKSATSVNESRFQMDRREYVETMPYAIPSVNKWIGESRDSSDVSRRRRLSAVGKSSMNTDSNSISFTSHSDINSNNSALRRVRSGGSVAPAKKGARK